jgi:hypothetical protein
METLELPTRDATEHWLLASLGLTRLASPSADALGRVTPWLLATLDDVPWLPPAGVVADVGMLLAGGRTSFAPWIAPAGARWLRAAVRAYEDEWLGRLASDRRADAAADAIARLPADLRPRAIALVVGSVLQRTGFARGASVSASVARRLLGRPPADNLARVQEAMRGRAEPLAPLAVGYEGLVEAARKAPRLLDDADVFALENLVVLGSAAQRVAIAQVMDAAADLLRALPRNAKPPRTRHGFTPTRFEDESSFPAGGFAAISNSGSLENLVTSEVVYMEDGPDIDLFDVRFAEGELLYYTRDEAVHLRPRRDLWLLLDPSLAALRFKDPELRWQRIVVLLGVIVCVVRRLHEWLAEEDLSIRVTFLRDRYGAAPLTAERGLVEILLREWIEVGTTQVTEASVDEAASAATLGARRAGVQALMLGPAAEGAAFRERAPAVYHAGLDVAALVPAWTSWVDATRELLRDVL